MIGYRILAPWRAMRRRTKLPIGALATHLTASRAPSTASWVRSFTFCAASCRTGREKKWFRHARMRKWPVVWLLYCCTGLQKFLHFKVAGSYATARQQSQCIHCVRTHVLVQCVCTHAATV